MIRNSMDKVKMMLMKAKDTVLSDDFMRGTMMVGAGAGITMINVNAGGVALLVALGLGVRKLVMKLNGK